MRAYDRFLSSLLSEFKYKAQGQVRSLWADLEELMEATGERARSTALRQAYCRITTLERAARAVEAHEVQIVCEALEHDFETVTDEDFANPEWFGELRQALIDLTGALYPVESTMEVHEFADQATEASLLESCVN